MVPDFKKLAVGLRMAKSVQPTKEKDPPINRAMVKQLFKNVGVAALGTGAGIAAAVLTGRLLQRHLGPKALKAVIGAGAAIGAAGALGAKEMLAHGHKLENIAARKYTEAMKSR